MTTLQLPGNPGPGSRRGQREPEPHYLTTSEVADRLHVSPKTISRWAKEGKLPYSWTMGGATGRGHRRYPEPDISQLAATLRHDI